MTAKPRSTWRSTILSELPGLNAGPAIAPPPPIDEHSMSMAGEGVSPRHLFFARTPGLAPYEPSRSLPSERQPRLGNAVAVDRTASPGGPKLHVRYDEIAFRC